MNTYPKIVKQKIDRFIADGIHKLHMVVDFDRTLTKGGAGYGGATTWGITERFLKPKYQEAVKRLYTHYRALELDGTMTAADAACWWESCLQSYIDSGISFENVKRGISKELIPRNGVKSLFKIADNYDIPIVIISAGIKNIIDYWCLTYGFKPKLVLSTELILNPNDQIIGWKKASLIHVLNKNERSLPYTKSLQAIRPNVILVGDSIDDATMADGNKNVLRILIDDLDDDEKMLRNETYIGKIKDRFDIHLTRKSIQSVVEMVKLIASA